MTQIRFGRLIVLACMGLAVACTSGTDGGTAGNTELNLDIVNPGCPQTCGISGAVCTDDAFCDSQNAGDTCNGATSCELGFTIDRVDYRISCGGNPGAAIPPAQYIGSPPLYTPCDADADCPLGALCSTSADAAAIGAPSAGLCAIADSYDDSVDISGQFETVDTRVPPVWQAITDLPPGLCTVTLSVMDDNGEIACIGSQDLTINEDATTKYDIVLVCSLSIDLPDGRADVDGQFLFITGNLCPKTYTLNTIPSVVPLTAIPPLSEVQFRAKDPDDGCGNNCDPQICSGANPPVCTPSVYNPNDARCLALAGGGVTCAENTPGLEAFCPLCDPTNPLFGLAGVVNPCCVGFDYTGFGGPNVAPAAGTVCTIVATPTFDGLPGGTFLNPLDDTTPVGPILPVNISDALNDGTGIKIPGVDANYICDPAKPGNVVMTMLCSDGDEQCDSVNQTIVTCPGVNFCDDTPIDCTTLSVCTTDGTCDPTCDPADPTVPPCDRCPGQGNPTNDGGLCSEAGGQVCDGGFCVQCINDSFCTDLPNPLVTCQLANTCDTGANLCQAGGVAPLGTLCDRGSGLGPGECNGTGTGAANCEFVEIDPDPVIEPITLGCTNNLTTNVSILPWELNADADRLVDGLSTVITYTGVAIFTESFLDAGLAAVPGLQQAALAPGNRGGATIIPKAGLSGADAAGIEIEPAPIATTCDGGMNAGGSCTSDAECPPVGYFFCLENVTIPTIDGTGDACAACNALGAPKNTQCADNGFCIAPGGLPIILDTVTGNYTASAPEVLLGWDETNQGGTNSDGTYILPSASFGTPWQPGGLRVLVGVLQIALNCVMAVDSGGPDGVGVPDQASPTPDSALLTIPVQTP